MNGDVLMRPAATHPGAATAEICDIDRVEVAIEPWSWEFAMTRRAEIGRHFARRQRERPGIWNGPMLLLNRYAIDDGVLRGTCFETDYASFLAWREWQSLDAGVLNLFAAAALRSADGAFLVGEMAAHTATAGLLYFPCGTPERDDIDAGCTLDLTHNLERELKEETGLEVGELQAEPGWSAVIDRRYIALTKRLRARQSADELRSRIMGHLAHEAQPEFADVRIVRGPQHLDPRMPNFVVAFLEHVWRQ